MRKILQKYFFDVFFTTEYTFQQKLLNIILLGAALGSSCSEVFALFFGFEPRSFFLTLIVIVLCILCIFIANVFKFFKFTSVLLVILANDFLFPFLYFSSDGMNSGMPVWITLGLITTLLLLNGKLCIIVFLINVAGIGGAIAAGYMNPELLTPMVSDFYATTDMFIAVLFVTLIIGGVVKFESHIFGTQQEQIDSARHKFLEASRAKAEFLSNVSHDIRTPMNAIIGYSEIARKNIDDRKRLMDCFGKISLASQQLLDLINGILEMSNIDSGTMGITESDNSLQGLIHDVANLLDNEMNLKNLKFSMDFSHVWEDSVLCDRSRMNQILINVITNAIHFSNENGIIYISVYQDEIDDEKEIVNTTISIRDEGCGIQKDFIPKIFEPFERERTSGKSDVSGIGLGLSITKKIVDMMNGKISIESEVNKGTEVIITIPFLIQTLIEITEADEYKDVDLNGKRILVVEDNPLNREIICDILTSYGCEVDEARDGTFAIEKVNMGGVGFYNMILMDIQMPVMDGYEATRIIRSFQSEELSNIPIVALSANAFAEDKRKALECGMNGFVTKPLSIDKLRKVLNLILRDEVRKDFYHD